MFTQGYETVTTSRCCASC